MRRTLVIAAFSAALAAGGPPASAADEDRRGRWAKPFWEGGSSPFDPPSIEKSRRFPAAVSATVLADGRLLYWNGLEGSENGDLWIGSSDGTIVLENSRVRLLDMGSGHPSWSSPTLERGTTDKAQARAATQDLFCSDQKLLYDGRVLIAGGSRWDVPEDTGVPEPRGVTATRIFEPASDRFTLTAAMREPRWYPSLVTLADGRVLIASGSRRVGNFLSGEASFNQVRLTEIYDPSAETWQDAGMSEHSFPLYPRLHLLPDGKVFYGGAGQSWNPFGQTADQATWDEQRIYDPATSSWRAIGRARYGVRNGAASVMLALEPPYDHADILLAGGALGSSPGTWAATTLSEVVRWRQAGITHLGEFKSPLAGLTGDRSQLRNQRWFGMPVMLPTGEVLLLNGGDADDVVVPGSAAGVRTPELYDPETNAWTDLAPASRDRVYHNSAVLLPDGRVLVGGNVPHPAYYTKYDNTLTRSNNFRDATFEVFEPPYLFRGERPQLARVVPARSGRKLTLTFGRPTEAADIAEVVLVRMAANTHSMDADMRAVNLRHRARGTEISASLPNGGDARILPPGPYYVFALSRSGQGKVPSVAQVVLIKPAPGGRVVAQRPPAD